MEILEQTPPTVINSTIEKTNNQNKPYPNDSETTKALGKIYQDVWKKLRIKYLVFGAVMGQILSLLWGFSWPLTPIVGAIIGLLYCYKKYIYNIGDLTDWQIAQLKDQGIIEPFNYNQVEPDSYDVLLGSQYTRINKGGSQTTWTAEEIIIEPNECLLAHTLETFKFPENIKGLLQGKSSWARLSLFVECAGLFDKGFEGTAVLELFNASPNPIKLKRGDKIAQMSFHKTYPSVLPYGCALRQSHYQKQAGARISWLTKLDRIVKIDGQ